MFYYSSDTEDEKAYKNWKKSIMLVWRSAANHKLVHVNITDCREKIKYMYIEKVVR